MKRLSAMVVVSFAVVALSGCGLLDDKTDGNSASAAGGQPTSGSGTAQPTPTGSAVSGVGSAKDKGDLPDPCTLLSKAEVTALTGRQITQVDKDDAKPGDATRYCQWQQDSGQLVLFLGRTTEDEFNLQISGAQKVSGVGEDAFQLSGHLYVLYGTVQIDVYSRGGTDERNLADSKKIVEAVMPRI
ncbi:hypothetical protein GCM10010172_86530 [Paractinoplanes ferrugineus]|uniref:DUF3558 domain-containing protein n=1 Tax=Paractinoplanes ferrugineus TaxID=113564 RepID=A0A919J8R7_9ACTN|nr:DUF3558 family protein [Actinoplanes ferrugineus]GIE15133.1 hypothetical protein Afe05nite_69730 [Actinoplanes ferrugineus]